MKGVLKLLMLSLLVLVGALAVDQFFVPPTAPIAWATDPQPVWQVEVSFLRRAIENIAAAIVAVILLAGGAFYSQRWLSPNARL